MSNKTPVDGEQHSEYGRLWSVLGSVNVWLVHGIASMVSVVLISLLFVTGAAASTESYGVLLETDDAGFMCEGDETTFLGDILDTILSFIVISAIPVFVILYQLDGLMELFALGADTKAKIKKHQRNLWVGAAKIFLAPAIITVVASSLGIGIPECIELMPWQ